MVILKKKKKEEVDLIRKKYITQTIVWANSEGKCGHGKTHFTDKSAYSPIRCVQP